MRVFHHYLLVKGENSSISHTRRNEVQGLVTKDSHWWSCLGLIFHQTIGRHESDLYFMTEKQQTNKSTWGIERLENSSWSWKSQEVGEALAKLTKTPGKKEKQNSTFVKKTLNMINEHESWRVNSQSFSCHALKKSLFALHVNQVSKPQVRFMRQWLKWDLIKNGENGPSYQREEFLPSDVLSGPSC